MKKARAIITYSAIALLCLAAFGGFLASKFQKPAAPVIKTTATLPPQSATPGPAASSAAATTADATPSPSPSPAPAPVGPPHVLEIMKRSGEMPDSHRVAIAQGEDCETVTRQVVEAAGGLGGIVKPGDTVILKPNLIRGRSAGSPVCTDWRVMQALADIVKECGAERIIVAEASPAGDAFHAAEYDKIQGVELLDMNLCEKEDCYLLKPEKSQTGQALYVPKIYMDADVVIGAAKLKTHSAAGAVVTLGLKLSLGVPPTPLYLGQGCKVVLHTMGLREVIVDLNLIRRPEFMVIDGIVAGEGYGPVGVTPVQANIMFAGSDIVALDTVALTYMGYTVDEVPPVKLASDIGIGISDLAKIEIVGADLDAIKTRFRRPYQ
jgi:uncharacterized protein (DUF362 family)